VLFISRGDNSGLMWPRWSFGKRRGSNPQDPGTRSLRKAPPKCPTLQYTDQKAAYTVIDRATFLTLQKQIKLVVLVEKDEALLNFISLIPVNPQKFPR